MFYYVFLDPLTIDDAVATGDMGLGRLVELLVGFKRDVLLVETDAWRVDDEIGVRVRAIPNQFQHERKQIKDLLTWLRRNGPLVILSDDNNPDTPLAKFAEVKVSEADIDLLLSPGEARTIGTNCVKASLAKWHTTGFHTNRNNLASGRRFKAGETDFAGVAEACFRKLVCHAVGIRVFDYALGEYYGNDHPENLKRLVRFLRDHATRLERLELITAKKCRSYLDRDIKFLKNEVNFEIEVDYRERDSDLPHPRYLGADHRYLDIDRGIDLCDAHNRCRSIHIKYSGSPE